MWVNSFFLLLACQAPHVSLDVPVVINEVNATNDQIELFNRTPLDFDLSGFQFFAMAEYDGMYPLEDGTTIEADSYLILDRRDHGIRLRNRDRLYMYDDAANALEIVEWPQDAARVSWCRNPNGTGAFTSCGELTLGSENAPPISNANILTPLWTAGGNEGSVEGTHFEDIQELHVDALNRIWASDAINHRVQIYDLDGAFIKAIGGAGLGMGEFVPQDAGKFGPESIASNSFGEVYVVDRAGKKVNIYDESTHMPISDLSAGMLVDPTGLAIGRNDHVYVADQGTDSIHEFLPDGVHVRTFQQLDENLTKILNKTETLAMYHHKNWLFATSENTPTIAAFSLETGAFLGGFVGAKQLGSVPEPGRFLLEIEGIAVDNENHLLFASDEHNGRYLVFDLRSEGLFDASQDFGFIGSFGRPGSGPGELLSADGITVAPQHDLILVADQGNHRIQAFALSQLLTTLDIP